MSPLALFYELTTFLFKCIAHTLKHVFIDFDVLLTVHLTIFISVFNQIDA